MVYGFLHQVDDEGCFDGLYWSVRAPQKGFPTFFQLVKATDAAKKGDKILQKRWQRPQGTELRGKFNGQDLCRC